MDSKLLGLRIRQAREQKRMSQEDLGAAVSKEQGAISEYESGRRKLAASDLPAFATALEVPLLYFFEEEVDIDHFDAAILNYLHQLPSSEDRQAAIDIMRIFAATIHRKYT